MLTCGLLVELEAARDQETSVELFLEDALPMVRTEPGTVAWFAVQFRRYHYGIFDAFPDEGARERHLRGPVALALAERAALFARAPVIHPVDILAAKLPVTTSREPDQKGLLVRLTPRAGRERELEDLVRATRTIVDAEPDSTAWFGLRFDNGDYGFFDAFPDGRARRAHILGKAPREVVKHIRLLGAFPRLSLLDVQAERFAT
jgi:quinol monooxygenase YgiN